MKNFNDQPVKATEDETLKAVEDIKKEAKALALKELRKAFPRTTEGYADYVHGYLYIKYFQLYIYYAKLAMNKVKPVPDTLVYPAFDYDPTIDDLVRATVERANPQLTKRETSTYHGKVLRVEDAKKILSLDVDVNLPDLPKTIIPYDLARDVIIRNPDHLALIDCPCRTAKGEAGCYPRDVCIMIGEPWVSFFLEHKVDTKGRRITQAEALRVVQEQHELGNVQTAFFKDACGNQLYGICNCCSCCCNSMASHTFAKAPIVASSGYIRETDYAKCEACGACVSRCSFAAIAIVDDKVMVEYDKCYGCGACEPECPHDAISLVRTPDKGEPLDIIELLDKYGNKQ